MSHLYRGPSMDGSYQVSVYLVEGFQSHISVIQFSYLYRDFEYIFLYLSQSYLPFNRNQTIRNKNCLWRPCLLMVRDEMSNLYRGFLSSFGSFGQAVSEKIFKNRPIRNKNCLWWPCLFMDRNEMNILYREPSIDAFYQVSVHLAEGFQRIR